MTEVKKLFYSIAEIADILSLHTNTIRRAIKQGHIKSVKFGDSHRIAAAELERINTTGFTLDPQSPTPTKRKRGRPRQFPRVPNLASEV